LSFINLPPETVIVSGDKSTLIMRPVFGEYYKNWAAGWRFLAVQAGLRFVREVEEFGAKVLDRLVERRRIVPVGAR